MNTELFIAKRIIGKSRWRRSFSESIMSIATFGIALGLAVMIVSVSIVTGFKKEISNKVVGFGSHIQVLNMDSNTSYETDPIPKSLQSIENIRALDKVKSVYPFAIKAGIIKTNESIYGAVFKGVEQDYDWSFIDKSIVDGEKLRISDTVQSSEVLLSEEMSNKMKLAVGDRFNMYFIQDKLRLRTFSVKGIYRTSLVEFDELYMFGDIKQVQKLNNWRLSNLYCDSVSGFEINIQDFQDIEELTSDVRDIISSEILEDGARLKAVSVIDKNNQIFDWLNLQDMNVLIIIILMLVVAGFNMISGLLILILERTNMIGILKALGSRNASIRKIFLYQSGYLAVKGLLWGNLLGLLLCFIQLKFGIISLDPTSYFLDTVPINLSLINLLLLNVGTLGVTLLFLLLPSAIISRISPEKSIKFN